ncbi:hypothetical protein HPB47_013585 [Ixodes persulcatus]|uniref:Uncharacterized protein n=1 Tax=Ixodes persulcatus TaxID=34615 RepID=A0AC60QZX3_IXOPE|nr:hypothetical protein HPB47_013585 [Ixodes persulcatus]
MVDVICFYLKESIHKGSEPAWPAAEIALSAFHLSRAARALSHEAPARDIVCGLCGPVSKTPVDPGCGHFYCLRCYRRILSDESSRCPLDDNEVLRDILQISVPWAVLSVTQNRIRCPNAFRSCQCVGEPPTDTGEAECALSHLEEHFAESPSSEIHSLGPTTRNNASDKHRHSWGQ